MKKVFNKFLKLILVLTFQLNLSYAQCVMCKNSIESSSNNAAIANGINSGILLLLPLPLIIVSFISIYYFHNKRKS